jgi:hypothetical protein
MRPEQNRTRRAVLCFLGSTGCPTLSIGTIGWNLRIGNCPDLRATPKVEDAAYPLRLKHTSPPRRGGLASDESNQRADQAIHIGIGRGRLDFPEISQCGLVVLLSLCDSTAQHFHSNSTFLLRLQQTRADTNLSAWPASVPFRSCEKRFNLRLFCNGRQVQV